MKATVVMASPRGEKGASSRMAAHFTKGLERAGVVAETLILKDYTIQHCVGCFSCWVKTPGKCVHRDDMDVLLPKMQTDLLVFATPLYIFSVPGQAKDFLDRQLPLIEPFLVDKNGVTSHPRRGSSKSPGLFLIGTAGFPERSHFDALVAMMKKSGGQYLGDILVGGAEPMSKDELQSAYSELYALIEKAGFEMGKGGAVSETTAQEILEKTTFSERQITAFQRTANYYWEAQLSETQTPGVSGDAKHTNAKEVTLSDGGMAAFMAGMALQYNSAACPNLSAVLQFSFERECFHLLIDGKDCHAYYGEHLAPDMTVITPEHVWLDISEGTLDGAKALMDGLYQIEGDMGLLMKLDRLFGPGEQDAAQNEAPGKKGEPFKHDEIPHHRGPIKIPIMSWLTVAFVPWIILWIWGGIAPGPLSRYAATIAAALIAIYHLRTNVITLFEAGNAVYLMLTSAFIALGWDFLVEFGPVIDSLFLAGLWLISLSRWFSLTAEYSRYLFPTAIWNQAAFIETNTIITSAWGGYFLLCACFKLIMYTDHGSRLLLSTLTYLLLTGMSLFTSKFQHWYPQKLLREQRST